MDISLDLSLAAGYKSGCQRARVLTEGWAAKYMYCPACENKRLVQSPGNSRVVDFSCSHCSSEYQLKAKSSPLKGKLRDGAYRPLMDRVLANQGPHFVFMHYDIMAGAVRNLLLVPKHFITPHVIAKCAPLSSQARRAGWVGCNLLTDLIPVDGRIFVVRDGFCVSPEEVRSKWRQFAWLAEAKTEARGWLADVLRCVRLLGKTFTLDEMYRFEPELSRAHPDNRFVKAQIRRRLQVLRDRGIIRFLGRGRYETI